MQPEKFERLYEEHAAPLFSFLAYRCGDRMLAEEVLSETFERAMKARRRFDARKASEKTWLYTIALNCMRDHIRRQAAETRAVERATVLAGAGDTGRDFEAAISERAELEAAMATLSDEEREAVALRFGADLTVPEIAKLTGESLTTMEGRVYRALRKLRSELG